MAHDIPPFNYCDYRCRRCDRVSKCSLYQKEKVSRLQHVLKGENPDDMEVVMGDVQASLIEAASMIERMAREQGVDLSASSDMEDEHRAARKEMENHPLYRQAYEFMDRCGAFLEECEKRLPMTPEIQEFFDEIAWNRTLIPAKAARAIVQAGSQCEYGRDDSHRTARLIASCLSNCLRAYDQILFYRPQSEEMVRPLKEMVKEMLKQWESFSAGQDRGWCGAKELKTPSA